MPRERKGRERGGKMGNSGAISNDLYAIQELLRDLRIIFTRFKLSFLEFQKSCSLKDFDR